MVARTSWPELPSTTATVAPTYRGGLATTPLSLFLLRGAKAVATPLVPGVSITLGRGADVGCDLGDRSVSRRHAVIRRTSVIEIEDLGSQNGTYVGSVRIPPNQSVPLEVDQIVRCGNVAAVVLPSSDIRPGDELSTSEEFRRAFDRACTRARRLGHDVAVFHVKIESPVSPVEVQRLAMDTLPECAVVTEDAPTDFRALCPKAGVESCDRAARSLTARLRGVVANPRVNVRFFPRAEPGAQVAGAESESLVVINPAMVELYKSVRRYAQGTISVLVNGETGVGKERVVERLHAASPRRNAPFLRLNCAAFTESLLESQLFGHEKGAFTGANGAQAGLLEAANGGTVFLDEVGELSVSAQVKLLRCLEDGTVLRVGSVEPRPIDVRFVAATNRDLRREVAGGRFREDLYFRIAAATIKVPPLRERRDEVEALAGLFIARTSAELVVPPPELSPAALRVLLRYSWPGNIREFRNVIERGVLLCSTGTIGPEHLPLDEEAALASGRMAPDRGSDEHEDKRAAIVSALAQAGGNQTKAARALGISRVTLGKRMDRYGISRPRKSK